MSHNFCELGMWAQLSWAFVLGSLTCCSQGIVCPVKINKFILKKKVLSDHVAVAAKSDNVSSVGSDSLWPYGLQSPTRLLYPWDSPGKNTGVCCHALLQGIFPIQGLNLCLMSPALAGRFFTTSTTWEALAWPQSSQSLTGRNVVSRLYDCWQDSISHGSLGW